MAKKVLNPPAKTRRAGSAPAAAPTTNGSPARGALAADIIIANAPDPVFVSDLEGKILQANDAVSQLLGFRQDEVVEQSLSRFISPEETTRVLGRPARGGRSAAYRNVRCSTRAAPRAR